MSALRYSGQIRIRVTYLEPRTGDAHCNGVPLFPHGSYRCFLRGPDGARTTIVVGAKIEHGSGIGVDSPEAFYDAARAAIAFAEDDAGGKHCARFDWSAWCAYTADGSGCYVGRSPSKAWGDPREEKENAAKG